MAKKKKNGLIERMAYELEMQEKRLEELIYVFYPNGTRVEFNKASQVGKIMEGSTSLQQFKKDEQMWADCIRMYEDADKCNSGITIIDIFGAYQQFMGIFYEFDHKTYKACIMFKAGTEDSPVYLWYENIKEGYNPIFLVDTNSKKAILIIEEVEWEEDEKILKDSDISFVILSELHAAILGDDGIKKAAFITRFSQADGICHVEKISWPNMYMLDNLFMYDSSSGDNNIPSSLKKKTTGRLQRTVLTNRGFENKGI